VYRQQLVYRLHFNNDVVVHQKIELQTAVQHLAFVGDWKADLGVDHHPS
jgi:hypothetical protein